MNEQILTLYYYDDGLSDAQRKQVKDALASDVRLAQRYAALCDELDALCAVAEVAAPAAAIGRWHQALDAAAETRRPRDNSRRPAFWLLPAAAALLLGIGIGLKFAGNPSPPETTAMSTEAVTTNPPVSKAQPTALTRGLTALTRGLTAYMQQSRVELAGLGQANEEQRLALIGELVDQNRFFERRATAGGAPELARVLRAFEQLLVELARQDTDAGEIAGQREQLAFEYAVMLTKLSRPSSELTHSL